MVFFPSTDLEATCALAPSCVVVWQVEGLVAPTSQPGFDYAVQFDAERDVAATTCDATYALFWEPDSSSGTYAVQEATDGSSTVGFESSGTVFGEGAWGGGELTDVSDDQCSPLPDSPPCP